MDEFKRLAQKGIATFHLAQGGVQRVLVDRNAYEQARNTWRRGDVIWIQGRGSGEPYRFDARDVITMDFVPD